MNNTVIENMPLQAGVPSESGFDEEVMPTDTLSLFLDEVSSQEGVSRILDSCRLELSNDPELVHLESLSNRIEVLGEEARNSDDMAVRRQKDDAIKGIQATMQRLFGNKVDRFNSLKTMVSSIEESRRPYFSGESASELAKPFFDESVTYLPEDNSQRFVNEATIGLADLEDLVVIDIPSSDGELKVPVRSIISAPGFTSWEGDGTRKGAEKIEDFSTRESDIPPIMDQLYALVLPDGRVAFSTSNSHRVAAAIKKGQQYIGFKGTLVVKKLGNMPQELR